MVCIRVLVMLGEVLMQTIYIGPIQMVLVIGMARIGLVHALLCVAVDVLCVIKRGKREEKEGSAEG